MLWVVLGAGLQLLTESPNDAGVIGDAFGAVNALFSGLAFAGVILALLLQTRDLQLQRQELEETRAELAKSAEAQTLTHAAMIDEARRENQRRCREATMHYIAGRDVYYQNWRRLINLVDIEAYKRGEALPDVAVEEIWQRLDARESALSIVGYYETLATCVNSGVFDEELVNRLLGANITKHYILFRPLMNRCRTEWGSPRYFDEFEILGKRLLEARGGK